MGVGTERAIQPSRVRRADLYRALFVVVDGFAAVVAVGVVGGATIGAMAFMVAIVGVDLMDRRRPPRLTPSALDDVPALAARGIVIAGVATVVGLPIYGDRVPAADHGPGPLAAPLLFAVAAATGRGIGYAVFRRLGAQGRLASPALIVGAGPVGAKIGWRMWQHPEYGLVPIGYVDSTTSQPPDGLPAPLIGDDVADLPKLIREYGVHHVFVGYCRINEVDLVDVVRACDRLDCEIFVLPRLYELGVGASSGGDHLWGIPLMRLNRAAFRCHSWTLKRLFDVVFAAVALVLASPLMLAVALALRLEVGPGVLFRQVRIGLDGRAFELLKFRTLRHAPAAAPADWSRFDPDRIGPVGRFLRRSSLDELPQLWNVLLGHMSVVGPRPEQPGYVAHFADRLPGYQARHRVPAGVTGWAQIHGLRGDTPIDDRVCFDNFYIEHWSLGQDLKILIRTAASIVRMRGG